MHEIFRTRLAGGYMSVRTPSGGRSLDVSIEYGLAYEFLMSLNVFFEHKDYEYEVGREWLDAVRAKATPDLIPTIQAFLVGAHHVWDHLVGLAYDSLPPRDVASFLAHLRETAPLEVRLHLMGYYLRSTHR